LKKQHAPVAYLLMRRFGFSLLAILLILDPAQSQVMEVPSAKTKDLPMYRPILIGKGPDALINRIDTQELMKEGQKDAIIYFICSVRKTGEVEWTTIYGGTPDSKPLEVELGKRLSAAADQRFLPAIYNRRPVDAIYYGTVVFTVVNGAPRLRIFSNQEPDELKEEHDFIGPQPFFGPESKFSGFHYPDDTATVLVNGVVKLEVKVDATGNLRDIKVVSEEPPFLGFGDAALADFRNVKFIPAFRNGKPVDCDVTLPVLYKSKAF
jgi:TonB family protein